LVTGFQPSTVAFGQTVTVQGANFGQTRAQGYEVDPENWTGC
jgi:hypothetical protein